MKLFKLEIKGYGLYIDDSAYETALDLCKDPNVWAINKLIELSYAAFYEGKLIKFRSDIMPKLEQIFDVAFKLEEDLWLKGC